MNEIEVKEKLTKAGFSMADVARLMDETPKNLNSMLRADDIKTGTLDRIALAVNKSVYFFYNNELEDMGIVSEERSYICVHLFCSRYYIIGVSRPRTRPQFTKTTNNNE